jgi:fatty acid desaturase
MSATETYALEATHRSDNTRRAYLAIPADLRAIRPHRWLIWFVVDWALIIGIFILIANVTPSLWLLPLVVLIIGSRQHALAILGHDATHVLAFKQRWLNDLVAELFIMWPLWTVLENGYRPWHFAHHRELGTSNDPELDCRGGPLYQGRVTWVRIVRRFLFDLFGFGAIHEFNLVRQIIPYTNPLRLLGPICLWLFTAAVFYRFGILYLLGIWALSLVTGFWAVFRVRAFAEHVGLPASGKETSHRFVVGLLSRFLFFPHNTWCHYEHHKWPQVPFYNLPQLRKLDSSKPILRFHGLFPFF